MVPVAVYDACVLFPAAVRDLMLRLGAAGLVQPRWSERILDECFRNILKHRSELSETALARTRERMCVAFPDAMVSDYAGHAEGLALPDPEDIHVVAAAIACGAKCIVTFNLRDFPASVLAPVGIEALHPDAFVLARIEEAPGLVCAVVEGQARALRNPPATVRDVVERLRGQGFPRTCARLADLLGSG